MTQTAIEVMWKPWDGLGLEHLQLSTLREGFEAEGVVLGVQDDQPFKLRYVIRCDTDWIVQKVTLNPLDGGADLILHSDGKGHWHWENGDIIPVLDGCIDVDFPITPFTNTLPIKRLTLTPGVPTNINVAYIHIPSLDVRPMMQQYTCLLNADEGGLYRYRSLASGFVAELPTDSNGLVIDYPDLFTRVWSR